jgi:hypothetical protein
MNDRPRGGVLYRLAQVERAIERIDKERDEAAAEAKKGRRWLITSFIAAAGVLIVAIGFMFQLVDKAA